MMLLCFTVITFLYLTDSKIQSWANPSGFEGAGYYTAIYWGVIGILLRFPIQVLISDFNAQHNQVPSKIFDLVLAVLALMCAIVVMVNNLNFEYYYILYALLIFPVAVSSIYLCVKRSEIPIFPSFDLSICLLIVRSGLGFLILGLPVSISLTVDNLLLGKYDMFADISSYAFSSKIFIYIYGFVNLYSIAFFGVVGAKSDPGEIEWVRSRIWFGANFLSVINGIIVLAICCFFSSIYFIWTGGLQSNIGFEYILTFALYVYTLPMVNILSSTLSGMNLKRNLIIIAYMEIIVHITISWLLIPILGLLAVPIALFISSLFVPYFLLQYLLRSTAFCAPEIFKINRKLLFFAYFPAVCCLAFLMSVLNMNSLADQCAAFFVGLTVYLSGVFYLLRNDRAAVAILKEATKFCLKIF